MCRIVKSTLSGHKYDADTYLGNLLILLSPVVD
jgi:hypothetical protein